MPQELVASYGLVRGKLAPVSRSRIKEARPPHPHAAAGIASVAGLTAQMTAMTKQARAATRKNLNIVTP
jgi:hypothetical protein